jgi:hypothetical protein
MNQEAVEELARQVAEAFNANFPAATADQPESRPEPQSHVQAEQQLTVPLRTAIAAQLSCCHPIPESLASKLPNAELCPDCAITRRVKAVQDVQQLIVVRGGIFASKHDDRELHKTVRQGWTLAKIDLANTVTLLEMLMADTQTAPEAIFMLKSALDTWTASEDTLIKVPGIVYIDDPVGEIPTEADHEMARLMIEVIRLVLEKEMTAEDKVALELVPVSGNIETCEPVHCSTPSVSQKNGQIPAPYDSLLDPSQGDILPITKALQHPTMPKPILRRRSSMSSMSSPDQKRLRMDEIATVSPAHLNTSNASPFLKLAATVTAQPHSNHTSAEDQRRRSAFWRGGDQYSPGLWASQAYEKKANTSYYKKSWEHMERKVEKGQKEAEEEKATFWGLNTVAGAWMGLWWFCKTKNVDLEVWRDVGMFRVNEHSKKSGDDKPSEET